MKPRTGRRLAGLILLVVMAASIAPSAFAQDTNRALQAYQDSFRDADTEMKLRILQTADMLTVEQLGPLYAQAIQYVLSHARELDEQLVLQDIALFAVEKIAEGGYTAANIALWTLFTETINTTLRIAVLDTIGEVAHGHAETILDLNGWVQHQANLYRGGIVPDLQVLRKAVVTAGELGDSSSFPVLLDVRLVRFSDLISESADESLRALEGDFVEMAIGAINGRGLAEREAALEYFMTEAGLSDQERAHVAAEVLSNAVREVVRDATDVRLLRQLRYRAVQVLIAISDPDATTPLIRHFYLTVRDYDNGAITKAWLLDAITALGNTGDEAAARVLSVYLDTLNRITEYDRPYDTQIVLGVVENLGRLGYALAYDAVFYATILDYPQGVKDAAREALAALSR
jgi:hypothetical protein